MIIVFCHINFPLHDTSMHKYSMWNLYDSMDSDLLIYSCPLYLYKYAVIN